MNSSATSSAPPKNGDEKYMQIDYIDYELESVDSIYELLEYEIEDNLEPDDNDIND